MATLAEFLAMGCALALIVIAARADIASRAALRRLRDLPVGRSSFAGEPAEPGPGFSPSHPCPAPALPMETLIEPR